MHRWIIAVGCLVTSLSAGQAEIVAKQVAYKDGNTVLEGDLVYDNSWTGKRPGVLVAHEYGVANGNTRAKASQIVRMGYVVFNIDLFGKGVQPKDSKEAATKLGLDGADRKLVRARALAGLEAFAKQPQVNAKQIAAVGYGWAGTAMLELARAGGDLESVAVVHGYLTSPQPAEPKKGGPWVFAILGSEDESIPVAQVGAFEKEMREGGFEWDVFRIGGAKHNFTTPGPTYDNDSDKRAHRHIKDFLAETFESNPIVAPAAKAPAAVPAGIPQKALTVLKHVDEKGDALPNYEGGRTFLNLEKRLPQNDTQGRRLKYREWDVNPLVQGRNRGAERLVTGSDGSAYFTDDHYKTFKKIR